MVVSPANGLTASGIIGGPFSPSTASFTLQNTGGTPLSWTAANTQAWVTLWATGGTLNPGASTTVGMSINSVANTYATGSYNDAITFTNTTNGSGNTTRPISLTISPPSNLSVTPANSNVGFAAGTTTINVSNTGGGTLSWWTSITTGSDWLSITSGSTGTNTGTITAAFLPNSGASPRQAVIQVTAYGTTTTVQNVTVTQAAGQLSLTVSGQRLVAKAWLIQREYCKLTLTVDNPAAIAVAQFVVYRKTTDQGYQAVQVLAGSAQQSGQMMINDAYLEKGKAYTYQVKAVDSLGGILSTSNEITL